MNSVVFVFVIDVYMVIVFNATFKKYFNYIVAVSFIGGGNRSRRRKPIDV